MSFKTEAFVLKAHAWREADRVYYLFTPEEGVIKVVLKSAAKSKSKLAGHLLPFSKVKVMIGRGKLDHMAGVHTIVDYKNIRTNLRNMSLASSIAELFLNEDHGGDKRQEFELLSDLFSYINDEDVSPERKLWLVRVFLWKYLSLSGWQPQLDNCQICGKSIQAGQYMPGRGIICIEHNNNHSVSLSEKLANFLKFIILAEWKDLAEISIDNELNREWLRVSQLFYQAVYDRPSQALKLFIYG
ncbi:DNA repair protein RecO [Candidatus Parcubacteria bacterium]|nr:MAG: DNA repair protein RecO [Candidatus Parcubacteria bacterium]